MQNQEIQLFFHLRKGLFSPFRGRIAFCLQSAPALDGRLKQCYNQSIAAGFYRLLALLIGTTVIAVMVVHFLLQVTKRLPQHIGHDASAWNHKQKVRHGFHLLSTEVLRNSVQPAATQWSAFHCRQTKLNHIYYCPSILFHAIIETTISKGKKFSYSFICGKGYSPPKGGE